MNFKILLILIVLIPHINTTQAISAAAGPGVIIIDTDVSQDFQDFEKCELIVKNTDIVPLRVHFSIQGDINNTDIININFDNNDFILQPNNKQTITVSFSAKAPGTYHGKIFSSFYNTQESGDTTGSGVGFAATTKVTINVFGEQPEGSVANVTVHDIGVNDPLVITAEFENTGNVVAFPYFTAAIIKNNEVIDTVSANSIEILPYKKQVLDLIWDSTGEGTGNYSASIKIELGEKILCDNEYEFMIILRDFTDTTPTPTSTITEEINTSSKKSTSIPVTTCILIIGLISVLLLVLKKK